MEIVLLGTGNPLPDANRAGAATLVLAGGRTLLVDAGRGVCIRLAGAGVLPIMLDAVLLTHLHSDHICDLNDVVTTRWVMSPGPSNLPILGPPGTSDVVEGMKAMLSHDVVYRLAHHADLTWEPQTEVREVAPGVVWDDGEVKIIAALSDHRPVDASLAFRVEHDGRSVVLGGDGVPCAGLDELCDGASAYVQTVLRDDLVMMVPSPRFQDTVTYHSTVEDAARTAARGGVETLVLTHQIPTPGPGMEDDWTGRAAAHFSGRIVFGEDLLRVAV